MGFSEDFITGINPHKEISNLWVENTYLRLILNEIINHLSSDYKINFSKFITHDIVGSCKEKAIQEVSKRFPNISLEYKSSASEVNLEEAQQCNPQIP
jgi:hypothetical protein